MLVCLISVVETSPRGGSGPASTVQTGLPKAVSPVQAAAIKHATSQSSISSSLGADSGVNLSPTHKDEKNPAPTSKPAPVARMLVAVFKCSRMCCLPISWRLCNAS
ncbi:hypothetical protein ANCCAN_30324 [Ancylostoma caninum]|uniref:Uncharacterized protein n=1 Tax=Ancylostoma caninum TaxID=29170 RepID=A0A368F1B2_ANCCA|nr:hypothetical protein ANCCAN_30324 [Ancylostoma caninum]